jgi:hypothetical protein
MVSEEGTAMAGIITPARSPLAEYRGLAAIFEFTNEDGELFLRNCGQAAAATLLTCHGIWAPTEERAGAHMWRLELHFPPDNLGGRLGTSRRCVESICQAHGVPLTEVAGEEALRRELDRHNPVLVMLGVSPGTFWHIPLPGGHWMVAYGYDREHIYLTNWDEGKMPWAEFRRRWRSWVAWLIRMRRRGLAAAQPRRRDDSDAE